jgi:hypothetical protein
LDELITRPRSPIVCEMITRKTTLTPYGIRGAGEVKLSKIMIIAFKCPTLFCGSFLLFPLVTWMIVGFVGSMP